MSNLIAVTGFANSGKTTLSIQLAQCFANDGYSVLLVFCDNELPQKEYLIKDNSDDSLGKLLTASEISEKSIMKAITLISDDFGILGYNKGEKAEDYPTLTKTGIDNFISEISKLCDYAIFDVQNKERLIFTALKSSGAKVVHITESTIKNIVRFKNASALWTDIAVLNNYYKGQVLGTEYVNNGIVVPHSDEVFKNFEDLNAFKIIKDKAYMRAISEIKKEI